MTRNRKFLIVSMLYFAEGFPFGIVDKTFPAYFVFHDLSVVHVGLLSLLNLPYALKFFWAPAVDFLGARRHWIAAAQLLMAALLLAILPFDPMEPSSLLWGLIVSFAIMSATQDIAVDAYTIEMLRPSELGLANGFRQAAYRGAMVLSGGILVAMGGRLGWGAAYFIAAFVLLGCCLISLRLPHVEVQRPPFSLATLIAPVKDFLARPGVIHVGLFILLYKLGDMSMGPMILPFWKSRGLTLTEIGLITGTLGVAAAIAGGLAGGLFMARYGIFHGLWFLGLWQSLSNLSYVWVAWDPSAGNLGIYAASVIESFCGGLGTAAFLAFLMSICKKEFSATQYAVLSALFRVTGIIAGAFSGLATDNMGYAYYFALTFFLSLPAFAFIFTARKWIPINGQPPQ
ncbi:MAG: MFS transporter [Desulfomonile tiedjei]|nr:MFS transporter [Desulfomonile tiedjei]